MESSGRPRDLQLFPSHHSYVQDYLIIFRVDMQRISKERLSVSGFQYANQREHTKIVTLSFAMPIVAISQSEAVS